MQNQMTSNACNARQTPKPLSSMLLWGIILVGLAIFFGAARDTGPAPTHDVVSPNAPETEEWHGNVRRGG